MKKKILLIIFSIILILSVTFAVIIAVKNNREQKLLEERQTLEKEINSHYNEYVITSKDTKLYKKENNKYVESGRVSKNVKLTLEGTGLSPSSLELEGPSPS